MVKEGLGSLTKRARKVARGTLPKKKQKHAPPQKKNKKKTEGRRSPFRSVPGRDVVVDHLVQILQLGCGGLPKGTRLQQLLLQWFHVLRAKQRARPLGGGWVFEGPSCWLFLGGSKTPQILRVPLFLTTRDGGVGLVWTLLPFLWRIVTGAF